MTLLFLAMLTKLRGLHEWMESLTSDSVPAERVADAPWTLDRSFGSCIYFRLWQCLSVIVNVQSCHAACATVTCSTCQI